MKAQGDECDGWILLGDNRVSGSVTLRLIRFRCVRVWFSTGLSCQYIHMSTYRTFRYVSMAWGVSACNVFAASAHICRMSLLSVIWLLATSWCQRTNQPWNPVPQNPSIGIDIHIFHIISNLKTQTVSVLSQNLSFLSQFDIFCLLTLGVEFAVPPNHTHALGRTPLHEWSAPSRDIHLTTHKIHADKLHSPGRIRTHNLSKREAADLRPCIPPRGHWDRRFWEWRTTINFTVGLSVFYVH